MKVLFITEYFFPKIKGGGEISCFLLGKYLTKLGVEVHILTSKFSKTKEEEIIEGMFIHRKTKTGKNPSSVLSNFKRTLIFPKSVKENTKKLMEKYNFDLIHYFNINSSYGVIKTKIPKIMHINSPTLFCPKGNLLYGTKYSCNLYCNYEIFKKCFSNSKYIGKIRNNFFLKYNPFFRRYIYKLYKNKISLLENFNHFIPISNFLAKRLQILGIHKDKISVVPNIIETEKFEKNKLKGNKLKIIYLGSYIESKGILTLLKSLKKLKRDYICNLYGEGILEKEIKKSISINKLKVVVNKKVKYKEIPKLISKHNVLILPSLISEAFGRVLVEAMASGCLPIASRVGGTSDIIKNKKNGYLFEPGDDKELNEILNNLKLSEINKEQLIEESKKYQGENIAKRVLSIYKK
jgi:glycosyltransferase involved in cell wall biosynthesis